MSNGANSAGCLYLGHVAHRRLRPVRHVLRYRVFSLFADTARLDELARSTRLFSHNRFNLLSFHDRDFGNGLPLNDYLAKATETIPGITRFSVLCYPRVLGYSFNPLTVFFGYDATGAIVVMLYEVSNTFGQRKTYVLPVECCEGTIAQSCDKRLYVSPFNNVEGQYSFRVTPPGETITLGVALRTDKGPLLNAYFAGTRQQPTTGNILAAVLRTGFLTLKVVAGIHVEAARLWLKGLRLRPRPSVEAPDIVHQPQKKL